MIPQIALDADSTLQRIAVANGVVKRAKTAEEERPFNQVVTNQVRKSQRSGRWACPAHDTGARGLQAELRLALYGETKRVPAIFMEQVASLQI